MIGFTRFAIAVSTLAALGSTAGAGTAAAMFRGDASHLGLFESPAPTLESVAWRFQTKGRIFSSPTVHDGLVYVGSTDHRLYAVRAGDGSQAWAFSTKGAVNSTQAVAGGIVFFSSLGGNVYGVDASDGTESGASVPAASGDSAPPGIHGIRPSAEVMPDPFDVFLSSPAVWDGTVYVGSGDHNVYALDARTGALAWKFATGDDRTSYNQVGISGSAAIANGLVYFGCRDSHFYAVGERTGALRWKRDQHGSWVIGSPAIAGSSVYYTTSDERKFYAVDAMTGALRFSVGYGAFAFSSPSIAGNVAYYGAFDGRLYGVDARSGSIVSRFSTDASERDLGKHLDASGSLNLGDFYRDETLDATIVGLNSIYGLGSILGSAAIAGGTLFIGSSEGSLYAIR